MTSKTSGDAAAPKRGQPIYGAEHWASLGGAEWCHFDRWFAIVIVTDVDGDPDVLRPVLEETLRGEFHRRDEMQAKLSHLADLRLRLDAAGLDFDDLIGAEEVDKKLIAKARRKVLDQALEGRAMTGPMHDTPAHRLVHRARYGHWERFPTNPGRFYERLAGRRSDAYVPKGRSFDLVRRLSERLDKLDGPRRFLPDRLGLYRAFHTVGVELAERGDDSYGVIGEMRFDAFETYLAIDWADAGMAPADYWQDLCELVVSEVHALTYRDDTLAFRRVPVGQAAMIEDILLALADEYRAAYEDYRADEALQLVAWLHVAGRRYRSYVDAARRLGSDHWQPIVALAESAIAANRPELAIEVFRAANRPGRQRDHLRRQCQQLTGVVLDDEDGPHLRAVD